jgi:hypothetical protein
MQSGLGALHDAQKTKSIMLCRCALSPQWQLMALPHQPMQSKHEHVSENLNRKQLTPSSVNETIMIQHNGENMQTTIPHVFSVSLTGVLAWVHVLGLVC